MMRNLTIFIFFHSICGYSSVSLHYTFQINQRSKNSFINSKILHFFSLAFIFLSLACGYTFETHLNTESRASFHCGTLSSSFSFTLFSPTHLFSAKMPLLLSSFPSDYVCPNRILSILLFHLYLSCIGFFPWVQDFGLPQRHNGQVCYSPRGTCFGHIS